jgi:large subunit ribosomal protein L18
MAKNSNFRVQLRRRREGKTDYQARKALVISRKPRLVTRQSLKNVNVQILVAKPRGDEILAAANSRELIKNFGWKAPTGNVPAAYLTGLLCGLKAKAKGAKEAILDIGLVAPTKGAKTFAALDGVLDAGVEVPHSEEKIVRERLKGEHIAKYAKSLGAGSEGYAAKFSKYTAAGIAPEKISEYFNKVKAEIVASFKAPKPATETAPKAPKAPKERAKVSKKGGKKA